MSDLKSTPGPWEYTDGVVWIATHDDYGEASRSKVCDTSPHNASLIAAAPDMLEALEEAVGNCGCSVNQRISGHLAECLAPEWSEIIAKAKGESL